MRRGDSSGRTIQVTIAVVCAHLAPGAEQEVIHMRFSPEDGPLCDCFNPMDSTCAHWKYATSRAGDLYPESSKHRAVALVVQLWRQGQTCEACKLLAVQSVDALASAMHRSQPHWSGVSDPLEMAMHPSSSSSSRKRRYDEDYRAAIALRVVQEDKSSSVSSYARAQSDLKTKTAEGWSARSLNW